jgi:YidC/Oxa1 family membrane protein insertase
MTLLRAATWIALALVATGARASTPLGVDARSETLQIDFAVEGAQPLAWRACWPGCEAARNDAAFGSEAEPLQLAVAVPGDPELSARIAALPYRAERREDGGTVLLDFASEPLAEGVALRKSWRIPAHGYQTAFELAFVGAGAEAFVRAHPVELRLTTGRAFEPPHEWGFAGLSEVLAAVRVEPGSVGNLGEGPGGAALAPGSWAGVRNRFWALLARSDAPATVESPRADTVVFHPEPAASHRLELYSGPIERQLLRAADPALEGLLFSHLWFWMRWLSTALLLLLGALRAVVGNEGVAILLLALCVKVLMRPLTATAERWQRGVNETRTRLQPELEAIKAGWSGSERSRRMLDLHREHGVNPFYGLKSLLGVLIQIPVFIAAYHMLDENFALSRVGFLWIADLAEPDRMLTLPFAVPFFGDSLNLLPFVMSGVTIVSSRLHDDGTLAPELLRGQRRGLYAMAFAFFALFYSFPAGMVLYWTSNNLVALAKDGISRWIPRGRDGFWRLALDTFRR